MKDSTLPRTFVVGDAIHWIVQLAPPFYPSGLLCSSVQARLFPSIPSSHPQDEFSPPPAIKLSSFSSIVHFKSSPVTGLELGSEYLVSLGVQSSHILPNHPPHYQLSLECNPLPDVSLLPSSPVEPSPLLVATSHVFRLAHLGQTTDDSLEGNSGDRDRAISSSLYVVRDISPLSDLIDLHQSKCPLIKCQPSLPLTSFGSDQIYDRDALVLMLDAKRRESPYSLQRTCPLPSPFERVCVDTHRYYKLHMYAGQELRSLVAERDQERAEKKGFQNLYTLHLYPADMPYLHGDTAEYPVATLRQSVVRVTDGFTHFLIGRIRRLYPKEAHALSIPMTERQSNDVLYLLWNGMKEGRLIPFLELAFRRLAIFMVLASIQLFQLSLKYSLASGIVSGVRALPWLRTELSGLVTGIVHMATSMMLLYGYWVLVSPFSFQKAVLKFLTIPPPDQIKAFADKIRTLRSPPPLSLLRPPGPSSAFSSSPTSLSVRSSLPPS